MQNAESPKIVYNVIRSFLSISIKISIRNFTKDQSIECDRSTSPVHRRIWQPPQYIFNTTVNNNNNINLRPNESDLPVS